MNTQARISVRRREASQLSFLRRATVNQISGLILEVQDVAVPFFSQERDDEQNVPGARSDKNETEQEHVEIEEGDRKNDGDTSKNYRRRQRRKDVMRQEDRV